MKENVAKTRAKLKEECRKKRDEIEALKNAYSDQLRELRKELKEEKSKIYCQKCKYCITEMWNGRMRCARPKKNRRICSDVTDVGAEIWADDVFTKALNCPFYEEDGTEKRDYADLDEETRLFWKCLHEEYYYRYLSDCKTTEEGSYEWSFISMNKEMKEYIKKRSDESNIEAEV